MEKEDYKTIEYLDADFSEFMKYLDELLKI